LTSDTAITRSWPLASTTPSTGIKVAAGQVIQDCDTCPEVVVVPAGSFMMGSPASEGGRYANEGPRHLVSLKHAFAIGKFEVTFDDWNACVADGACLPVLDFGWGQGRRPVSVLFIEALRYVAWLSQKTGQKYFLPSEAEWEYAARAGSDTPWNTGEAIISDDANILNQFARTVPVGGFPPNAFGLHDTHGNVAEWVQDCFDTGYFGVPADGGAALVVNCPQSITRGGGFGSEPRGVRSASRILVNGGRAFDTGFRVARALSAP
jgi:formylglycine-generating enzyme required for sulfatase activity